MEEHNKIAIVGAGLTGSLMAYCLAKRGYYVDIFEKREDPRSTSNYAGKSINLALSTRGLTSLRRAGLDKVVADMGLPMHGRMIHPPSQKNATAASDASSVEFQQYGVYPDQHLLSISREHLNQLLIDRGEKEYPQRVKYHWYHDCLKIDINNTSITIQDNSSSKTSGNGSSVPKQKTTPYLMIIGADGSFSKVRQSMQNTAMFDYSQSFLDHGYKELNLPPIKGPDGKDTKTHRMSTKALHIWPRGKYMMIGLPNLDGSYTITLFMPWKNFNKLTSPKKVIRFFKSQFPDFLRLLQDPIYNPDGSIKNPSDEATKKKLEENAEAELIRQFSEHPTASLVSIRCSPFYRNRTVLIGDACHGVVPFYGQGMNAGLEDVRVFCEIFDSVKSNKSEVWVPKALESYFDRRKKNMDAISDLSLQNYSEMRDRVNHSDYKIRKKLDLLLFNWSKALNLTPEAEKKLWTSSDEAEVIAIASKVWMPLYSMVTFTNIPYAVVIEKAKRQDAIVAEAESKGLILSMTICLIWVMFKCFYTTPNSKRSSAL